ASSSPHEGRTVSPYESIGARASSCGTPGFDALAEDSSPPGSPFGASASTARRSPNSIRYRHASTGESWPDLLEPFGSGGHQQFLLAGPGPYRRNSSAASERPSPDPLSPTHSV